MSGNLRNRCRALACALLLHPALGHTDEVLHFVSGDASLSLTLRSEGPSLVARAEDGSVAWRYAAGDAARDPCAAPLQFSVLRFDANADQRLDPRGGDYARVFISTTAESARGGSTITALAILPGTAPQLLWTRDSRTLAGLGRLSAAPTPVRIEVGSANVNTEHFGLLLGNGVPKRAAGRTPPGRLLLLDADDGRPLWTASGEGMASQHFPAMSAAIAAPVTALDTDSDGYTDRAYVGDLHSSLWRFDFRNGKAAGALAAGGRLARLDLSDPQHARGFHAAADVALVVPAGRAPAFNISLGTHGNDGALPASNWFFVVRDTWPFNARTQAQYDSTPAIIETDLPQRATPTMESPADTTPFAAAGFRVALGSGEVSARALTVANVLLFSVVQRQATDGGACAADTTRWQVKVTALSALDGSVALDLDHDGKRDVNDTAVVIDNETDATLSVSLPDPTRDGGNTSAPSCRVGTSTLADCISSPPISTTYWRREDAD